MQQLKDIESLSEIDEFTQNDCRLFSAFQYIMANINLQGISRMLNNAKSKGVKPLDLFRFVFVMPFVDLDNVHQLMQSGLNMTAMCRKDTLYRFLNNPAIPWRKIHHSFFVQLVKLVIKYRETVDSSANPTTPPCFILDDTLFPKTGKAIEGIGKVYDHITHTHKLGIKALVAGLWDGTMFLPFDLSLHHEPRKDQSRGMRKKDIDTQFTKSRNVLSPSYGRLKELGLSKIEVAKRMLHDFLKLRVGCRYVLGDSWFTCHEILQAVENLSNRFNRDLDYIGLIKMDRKIAPSGKKQQSRIRNILAELNRKKKPTRCKKYKCYYQRLKGTYKGIEATFFFVRMSRSSNWKCMICTDTSLSFTKAMELYSIRWTIEVFFKDAKQNLNLGKCQSNDFDAHIATNTLTCMNYMAIAVQKRFNDYETIGHMFKEWKNQLLHQNMIQKLWELLSKLLSSIFSALGIDWDDLMRNLISEQNLFEELYSVMHSVCGYPQTKGLKNCKCET